MKNNTLTSPISQQDFQGQKFHDELTEFIRLGAQNLIKQALEAELQVFMREFASHKNEQGRKSVVRNGYHPTRSIATGIGGIEVRVPKVRSRSEESVCFRSSFVPPYIRRTQSIDEALPWLYLKGVSTGNMQEALSAFVGVNAKGFSPCVVSRLKHKWLEEYKQWSRRKLDDEWVYLWMDGIYSNPRGDEHRQCVLVVMGVNSQGEKHLLAIEDGARESTQSWKEVLLSLKDRGLDNFKLAIGDGAMGLWSALSETYPEVKQQRCWVHKTKNVLNSLPKSVQPKAKSMLQEIWMAETQKTAEKAFDLWLKTFQDKYPKAAECLSKDRKSLLVFYAFPASHWQHIRTTNPIESTFATIRHRSKQSKGCLSRNGILSMIFKLGATAQKNWRRIRGYKELEKLINGVKFKDGIEIQQDAA